MNDQEAAVLAAAQEQVDTTGGVVADLRAEKNVVVAALKAVNDKILEALPSWDKARVEHRGLEQQYRVGYYGAAAPDALTSLIGGDV